MNNDIYSSVESFAAIARLEKVIGGLLSIVVFCAVLYNSGYALVTVYPDTGVVLLIIGTIISAGFYAMRVPFLPPADPSVLLFIKLSFLGQIVSTTMNAGSALSLGSFKMSFVVLLAFFVIRLMDPADIMRAFTNLMVLVALISLLAGLLLKDRELLQRLPTVKNVNGTTYRTAYLFFVLAQSPERNTGIFWEPGLFGSFLAFAVLFIARLDGIAKGFLKILLIIITMITTRSTAVFIIIPLLLLVVLPSRKLWIRLFLLLLIIGIPVVIAIIGINRIFAILVASRPDLFAKVFEESMSVSTRLINPLIDWKLYLRSPVWGLGSQGYQDMFREYIGGEAVNAQTSTITGMLAAMGLFGLHYPLGIALGVFKQTWISLIGRLTLLVVFVLIVSKEPHANFVMTYILVFLMMIPITHDYSKINLKVRYGK